MIFTLLSLLTGDYSRTEIASVLVLLAALLFVMFVCLPVHETAHAIAANMLGDPTGKLKGRISLNPFAHLTLPGTLMMLLLGFGYARPVPVNIRNFKNRKLGFAITSFAGPVSNVMMAVISVLIASLLRNFADPTDAVRVIYTFFIYVAEYNFVLALFNMIPIPPLDGSRLVTLVLPDKYYYKLLQYERYFIYAIFTLSFVVNRLDFIPSLSDIAFEAVSVLENIFLNIFM